MAKFFIERPVFAIVTAIFLVLIGVIAGLGLPIAQYPQITLPTVQVSGIYPGANASDVEQSVAQLIEQQVNGVEGMKYMNSTSANDGSYSLSVTFGLDIDPDIAAVSVQNRVAMANGQLPQEVLNMGLITEKSTPDTLMYVSLYSPHNTYDSLFISNYAAINVVEAIKRIKGVGNVRMFGSEYGMRVWLKPDRMAALGITASDIYNAILEQNSQAPAGQVGQYPSPKGQAFQYSVQVRGRLTNPEEFGNIIVRAKPDGSYVRLHDIARVELGNQDYNFHAILNGKPSATFGVQLTSTASAIETANLISAELKRLSVNFPPDLAYTKVVDNTVFVKASLEEVAHTFFEALFLVLVVVYLFLQNWRATLIPMLAVPVSLIATFAAFSALGFTINTLTMFAMVLAIGIVVDDAIVVVEAVEHNMQTYGLSAKAATQRAMEDVSGPVVAVALVLAAVFVPVAFLGGITGVMYKQFAITVALSTLLSAFVALSLTPALCALILRSPTPTEKNSYSWLGRFFAKFNQGFDWFLSRYTEGIRRAIRSMILMLVVLGILIVFAFTLMSKVPSGFVPAEDSGYLLGSVILPEGASTERTLQLTEKLDKIVHKISGVDRVLFVTGFNIMTGAPSSNAALIVIGMKPWEQRTSKETQLQSILMGLYAATGNIPEAQILFFNPPPIPGLGKTGGLDMKLLTTTGAGPFELAKVSREFVSAASKRPEIGKIYTTFEPRTPAYRLIIDREKVKKLGVRVSDVTFALQSFLGGLNVNDFSDFGRTYKVTMQADQQYRDNIRNIDMIYVRSSDGKMIPLNTFVSLQPTSSPSTLSRYMMFGSADIGGEPAAGYSSGQAMVALEQVAKEILPQGYTYKWSGLSREEKESSGRAPIIFCLSIVFVFLFLAALYESWTVPFAVLFAVPLGILGAMGALKLMGLDNNIYAQIGLILLIGLAAKNAILIVEFAKLRYDAGMSLAQASIEAARLRLRPILMTSIAFILGVLPLVLSKGAGAASRVSMGVTVFGGMLTATLLGVFFVPVLYVAVEGLKEKMMGRKSKSEQTVTSSNTAQIDRGRH